MKTQRAVLAIAHYPNSHRIGGGRAHRLAAASLGQFDLFSARHFSKSDQIDHWAAGVFDAGCWHRRWRRFAQSRANGRKALIYFEVITTLALFLGLAVVNITKPGVGVPLVGAAGEAVQKIGETHPRTFIETLVHIFPASVVDSLVRGDILQIVAFAVLFAMAVSAIGEKGRPMLVAMESLSQVMFKLTNYVMRFAPFGVAAAMAHRSARKALGIDQSRQPDRLLLSRADSFS